MGTSPHLERAYQLAADHYTHPNPKVGAVVVSSTGDIIGEGAHRGPPNPHAEVVALDAAGDVRGATIYVSLEPCVHHGRTPPCVDRLIAAGVTRVVVGMLDPDSRVAGKGVSALASAGIEVNLVDDPEAREVDPGYFHQRQTGLPLVTAKWATTLDGSVAAQDGSSQWITSGEAREDAHRLRAAVDAVAVGAGTLREDDPRLDVRLEGYLGHQPRPVVIAGIGELPLSARVWKRDPVVVSTKQRDLPGGELLEVDGADGRPDPIAACRALADLGFYDILLEGGPTIMGAWWRSGVITRGIVYIGPKVGGGTGRSPMAGVFGAITDATDVELVELGSVANDVIIRFQRRS